MDGTEIPFDRGRIAAPPPPPPPWSRYTLRTSERLGATTHSFTLLETLQAQPFLRYRASYVQPASVEGDGGAFAALRRAVEGELRKSCGSSVGSLAGPGLIISGGAHVHYGLVRPCQPRHGGAAR